MRGIVVGIRPVLMKQKLKVVAQIRNRDEGVVDAFLPDREVSAIVPRSVLIGDSTRAPKSILKTIRPILRRMAGGRQVRLWRYGDAYYFAFLPWRSVNFLPKRSTRPR